MNMKFKMKVLPFFLLFCLLLTGCAENRKHTRQLFAMDTVMHLTAYGASAENALNAVEAELGRLDAMLSVKQPVSDIYRLNTERAEVSEETAALVSEALRLAAMTGGSFDPTLYPVVDAWGFFSQDYRIPEEAELAALLQATGWQRVAVSGTTVSMPEGFALDLGGIGKGYAGTRVAEVLRENGVSSALLSLGGNVQAVGAKPDGKPWVVGIQHPETSSALLGTVDVENACVITSGGYQRFFERDGVRYWHILDPQTGKPARSGLRSVTIVSENGTAADALSTALFVMGAERAEAFWRHSPEPFEAVWMTEDDKIYITEGLRGSFRSSYAYEVVSR